MPDGILLNQQKYSHEDLLNLDPNHSGFTKFESEAIEFYQQWNRNDPVFQFKTSGTTGKPKVISFSRENLIQSANFTLSALDLKPYQNCLVNLSPRYVAGKMMLVRAFVGSLNLVAVEPSSNPLQNLQIPVDFAAFVPNQLHYILHNESTRKKLQEIDKVIIGGGDVFYEDIDLLKEMTNDVYHTYGMTETLTHIAFKKISGKDPNKYFRLLEGFQIETDERNCLKIKTPYRNNWLITNDLVKLFDENHFMWEGRLDHVINSGGVKISPEEYEPIIYNKLSQLNIKNPFFLAGIPDQNLGQKAVLIIQGKFQEDISYILSELKRILPQYKNPKEIILLSDFDYTSTGKLNRKATLQKLLKT